MLWDKRLFYICSEKRCPFKVSVRLPTGSCKMGCWYCCNNLPRNGWKAKAKREVLTVDDYIRIWKRSVIDDDWRWIYPNQKIRALIQEIKVLRFVREDLFFPTIKEITALTLEGLRQRKWGLLVRTSNPSVVRWIPELHKIKHAIVFTVSPLHPAWKLQLKTIHDLTNAGVYTTASVKPLIKYDENLHYILNNLPDSPFLLGVDVGFYHGFAKYYPPGALKNQKVKYVMTDRQLDMEYQSYIYYLIRSQVSAHNLDLAVYFSAPFSFLNPTRACCFGDKVLL